jgi:hypothetical protein
MAQTLVYVDAVGGSDGTGDGSSGNPYQTMQYALDQNSAGGDGHIFYLQGTDTLTGALTLATFGNPSMTSPLWFVQWPGQTQGYLDGDGTYAIYDSTVRDNIGFAGLKLGNCGSALIVRVDNYFTLVNCEIQGSSAINPVMGYGISVFSNNYIHSFSNANATGLYITGGAYSQISDNWISVPSAASSGAIFVNSSLAVAVLRNMVQVTESDAWGIRFGAGSYGDARCFNNSVISTANSTGDGINIASGYNEVLCYNNVIEGFSGTGGHGIDAQGDAVVHGYNYSSDNATDYNWGVSDLDLGDDESGGNAPFAKSGSNDFANRFTYFEPKAEGNLRTGGHPSGSNISKGAVQYYSAGGGGGAPGHATLTGGLQ